LGCCLPADGRPLPRGLNIKNAETHRLVKELAALTGESMTAAVTNAVRERLERVRVEPGQTTSKRES
jgi:antitoxin VapB